MESRIESNNTHSHQQLHQKFTNLNLMLGIETEPDAQILAHPLMHAIDELYQCRKIKYNLYCYLRSPIQRQAMENVNELIHQLREFIREEINQTSVDDLTDMSIDLGRKQENNLLEFLAEIGEAFLFDQAHTKLANYLSSKDYIELYSVIRSAYIGSDHSEALGLGFIDLARGNKIYIQIINELFSKIKTFDPDYFSEVMQRAPFTSAAISKKVFIDKDKFVNFKLTFYHDRFSHHEDLIFDKPRKRAQLEELYKEYVLINNEINLMDEFESNLLQKIPVNPYGFLSSASSSFNASSEEQSITEPVNCIIM
ncbi:MAG: hypothetical protein BGO90_10055 [Legionella sp. 40-6]|nr:hypothetical protein [Legionella sp.]OJY04702.1 MAG: hypothetical protein BGO90_10055 [Legionella sp. 40-6]